MMLACAEAEVCRRLWVAVVAQAAHDLLAPRLRGIQPNAEATARGQVLAWLGSRDFHRVCALAGLDGATVAARLRAARMELSAGVLDWNDLAHGTSAVARGPAAVALPAGGFAGQLCALPGCGRRLSRENGSGVCRRHNHAVGYCRCATCVRGPA